MFCAFFCIFSQVTSLLPILLLPLLGIMGTGDVSKVCPSVSYSLITICTQSKWKTFCCMDFLLHVQKLYDIQQWAIFLHCGILFCWTNSSKCIFKNLLFIGTQTMLTDKKIRFHISAEISNEIKIQMRYLACMVFISMSLKSMISLVWVGFERVPHTKETVGLSYEVYTVTYLRGY